MMYEECPHGRHKGAYCGPCAEEEFPEGVEWVNEKQEQSGLDAPYYDFPKDIHSAMDLIEWLNLDFAQGNILKSIIRENNPNAQKKTTPIYEAEKQYYYSERRLRALQKNEASGG